MKAMLSSSTLWLVCEVLIKSKNFYFSVFCYLNDDLKIKFSYSGFSSDRINFLP